MVSPAAGGWLQPAAGSWCTGSFLAWTISRLHGPPTLTAGYCRQLAAGSGCMGNVRFLPARKFYCTTVRVPPPGSQLWPAAGGCAASAPPEPGSHTALHLHHIPHWGAQLQSRAAHTPAESPSPPWGKPGKGEPVPSESWRWPLLGSLRGRGKSTNVGPSPFPQWING